MRNRITEKFIAVLILVMVIFSLTGCRESMVIQEILYDQASEDIDFQNDLKVAKSNENSQTEDEDMPDKKTEKSDDKNKEEHQASKKGDKDNDGSASRTTYNKNSKNDDKNNSSGKKTGNSGEDNSPKEDTDTAGATDDPNSRQIYDSNGNVIDLPEEVNSVVVAGDAAPIVQMLGGKGIISGSSADFTGNSLAQSVFAGEDLGEAETLWSDDGSSAMSSESFNKLLKMKPDVCVNVSGQNSFSDSQLKTLKNKKISVVTIPSLNTADNIQDAVTVLGDMIGDRSGEDGGVNAKDLASEYEDYCDSLVSAVQGKTGRFSYNNVDYNNDYYVNGTKTARSTASNGKYALYVSGWDSCTYKISTNTGSTIFSDSGVATVPQGYSRSPLSYYLSVAGVCNNGARLSRDDYSTYAAVPFNRNVFKHTNSGSYAFYRDTLESFLTVPSGSNKIALGDSNFKTVIVDSSSTKNKIKSSPSWKKYDKVTVNTITDYGFEAEGKLVTSYVRGDYDVYVNPYGVCSWTEGSVESVLECKWAAWRIQGAYSESEVKSEIKKFYSKFYRYELSDSEVNRILGGK
ncbi:MAG: hypothetical protein ACI4LD_03530 [Lentihominibacter sp.]